MVGCLDRETLKHSPNWTRTDRSVEAFGVYETCVSYVFFGNRILDLPYVYLGSNGHLCAL